MGSEEGGFAFMTVSCKEARRNPFFGNTVSSVKNAALVFR